MILRSLKNRLENLSDRKSGKLLITFIALVLFLHQMNIFTLNYNNKFQNDVTSEGNTKIEDTEDEENLAPKDPNLDSQCQCKELVIKSENSSMCSDFTKNLGENLKVISVSVFREDHLEHLKHFSDVVYEKYPGYYLRVHHNFSEIHQKHQILCDLFCQNNHIDLCHTKKIGKF